MYIKPSFKLTHTNVFSPNKSTYVNQVCEDFWFGVLRQVYEAWKFILVFYDVLPCIFQEVGKQLQRQKMKV